MSASQQVEPGLLDAREVLYTMQLIRSFDERVVELYNDKLVRGSAHPYIGMEAIATGIISALGTDDLITSTHRGHGHCLARGLDPARMFAEVLGRKSGYCRGKGGSMHITAVEHGMLGADGIVGGSHAIAVGAAYGSRLQGRDTVVACFFGDGAANEGSFHEACNLAAVLDAPVIFVCENNGWALSTRASSTVRVDDLSVRAAGYGFPGFTVDGNDVHAVRAAANDAVARARAGRGPTLIEAKTHRMSPHSAFATGETSTREELEAWSKRDPIAGLIRRAVDEGVLDLDEAEAIRKRASAAIDVASQYAVDDEQPEPASAFEDVYAPAEWNKENRLA
ncbi:Acetoin:2,6-dichlorophenolindophenol oxidoreductase subunit alpha [Rhodococcus fascians]|uniref:thiamine pyrophosphate-dependent dehydrogenase E1 component subunit alpha n=1 Tax=Rhodococcoides fascians TaxID=1828 RepID=UPI001427CC14|nr:Acetoin:2,6-dichlorophenolindophenol oxidoreductase subunit alpha [Rhodococcus fascians]